MALSRFKAVKSVTLEGEVYHPLALFLVKVLLALAELW
jgi:hypothetical protein